MILSASLRVRDTARPAYPKRLNGCSHLDFLRCNLPPVLVYVAQQVMNPPVGLVSLWATAAATDGSGLVVTSTPVAVTLTREALTPPSLQIVSRGTEVLVLWQPRIGQEGFILESSTEANSSANWIAVDNTVEERDGVMVAIFPSIAQSRFFRLRRP